MDDFVIEHEPGKDLKPFVELFWEGSFNSKSSGRQSMRMIPNGCLDLIIHLNDIHCDLQEINAWYQSPDYMLIGLFTKPYEVQFGDHVKVFSIRFKPEGIYNIFGVPASLFKERFEDMSLVLGREFEDFSHRLREERTIPLMIKRAEEYLRKVLEKNKADLSYVNHAAEIIRTCKGIRIEDLPKRVYISQRQLEREFKYKIGISPKHYLRITRINEVMRLIGENQTMDLTTVAYQCGYFDQSHFIHDFKKITGSNPTLFIKNRESYM
jgi:AraC-like DNA-binding protein